MSRLAWRLVSLRFWVKSLISLAVLGLVIVPSTADLVNAVTKTATSPDGTCRILQLIDGETIMLMCPGEGIGRAQVIGYDTPERYAPKCLGEFLAAERAIWALRTMIQKADKIAVSYQGIARNGRKMVRMYLDGLDVAKAMVRAGHARQNGGGLRGSWCI